MSTFTLFNTSIIDDFSSQKRDISLNLAKFNYLKLIINQIQQELKLIINQIVSSLLNGDKDLAYKLNDNLSYKLSDDKDLAYKLNDNLITCAQYQLSKDLLLPLQLIQ